MLSNQHFYHRIIRKMVVSFGTMFNNVKLVRYNQAGTTEIERINVPIVYANKEKFYKRITEDPNLANQTLTVLPRMAFEMTGISYDPLRKISSQIDLYEKRSGTKLNRIKMTPYNFDFNLSLFVRNTEDGTQIIEQILPYFSPDYTISVDFVSMDGLVLDVPIVLESVTQQSDYEGLPEPTRTMSWDLGFSMKGYLFGPMSEVSVIRKVTANIYDATFEASELKKLHLNNGSGNYKTGELVYQGGGLEDATASGFVRYWSNTQNTLVVYDTSGLFQANSNVIGFVSNTKYNLNTLDLNPNQLVNITVQPDPLAANSNDDFGFTTTITELI